MKTLKPIFTCLVATTISLLLGPSLPSPSAPSTTASRSYIIQSGDLSLAEAAVRRAGGNVTHELGIINAVAADLSPEQLERLRADKSLTLTANGIAHVAATTAPTTSSSVVQPYVVEHTRANQLHAAGITGRGVTIAFLDSGWWSQHATQTDTAGHNVVLQGYDAIGDTLGVGAPSDHYGHGTHVLSIATNSAIAQDGTYIGIAPDANRVVVRAFDQNGGGTYANTIRGIDWILKNAATYNIRIVNMSFGATPKSYYWDDPLAQAVMRLWQAGIVVVTSAGNEGPGPMSIGVPGNVPYVITVGAMTDFYTPTVAQDDRLASFSSAGPTYEGFVKPEIVAPGGHVIAVLQNSSTIGMQHPAFLGTNGYLGSSYFYMSGTSMASAVVSGVAALMLQAHPSLTPDQVKCNLIRSAHPAIDSTGKLAYSVFQQGAGEIDAYAAVFNQTVNCANAGLNIAADLAGTQHFGGPANRDSTGNYYVMSMDPAKTWGTADGHDGETWNQGYTWAQGYTWSQGYTWAQGYTWTQGYTWSQGYTGAQGYTLAQGYTWTKSIPWSTVSSNSLLINNAAINSWVDNE